MCFLMVFSIFLDPPIHWALSSFLPSLDFIFKFFLCPVWSLNLQPWDQESHTSLTESGSPPSWFFMLAFPLTELQAPSLPPLFSYYFSFHPLSSPLSSLFKKSHLDYGFQKHLHAKDSKIYTARLTSLLNSRLVYLRAYLSYHLPWMCGKYSKCTYPHQNMQLSFPPGVLHPALFFCHSSSCQLKIPLVSPLFRT